jgi:ketosteroid isomerase-like protein
MKTTLLRLLTLFALFAVAVRAADEKMLAAVRAADDERVAATKSGDRARLEAIYSDALHYAHSNGKIDTKASYIESLVMRTTVYEKYDYATREFKPAGPGIVLMIGRALIQSSSADGRQNNDLNFLSVWREENGKWRFLAWQSCKNLPVGPAKK